MSYISEVRPSDKRGMRQIETLLSQEGLRLDAHLDYTCALFDETYQVIATGSCFKDSLRCFAVDRAHQGEGLLNRIVSHLIEYQCSQGNMHLFLYTKADSAKFFQDLGFTEIERVPGHLVFMENRPQGFAEYLRRLQKESGVRQSSSTKRIGAVVMNANPFTYGHLYLVEKAAAACDLLHLFIVSEDASIVPFPVRKRLVMEGTAHLHNLIYHDSGSYIISAATFPGYFLRDEADVVFRQAELDIRVFNHIAAALDISVRFVGEEPNSLVTALYNEAMQEYGQIEQIVIPRKQALGKAISASTVRCLLRDSDWHSLSALVPPTTLKYFQSPEAAGLLKKMQCAGDLVHY